MCNAYKIRLCFASPNGALINFFLNMVRKCPQSAESTAVNMQVKYCSAACSREATILQNRLLAFSCSFQGCELFFVHFVQCQRWRHGKHWAVINDQELLASDVCEHTPPDLQALDMGGPCWIRFFVSPDLLGNAQVTNNTSHLSSRHSFVALGHLR